VGESGSRKSKADAFTHSRVKNIVGDVVSLYDAELVDPEEVGTLSADIVALKMPLDSASIHDPAASEAYLEQIMGEDDYNLSVTVEHFWGDNKVTVMVPVEVYDPVSGRALIEEVAYTTDVEAMSEFAQTVLRYLGFRNTEQVTDIPEA